MTAVLSPPPTSSLRAQRSIYLLPLLIVGIVLAVAGWYWETTAAMIAIWGSSETFAHGYVVLPIFAYLLWRVRDELAALPVKPYPPAILGVLLMGFGWLLGETASTASPAQFALVGMVACLIWTLLGTRVLRHIAFPLAVLLFAVPFGEFLLPSLMQWTADFTVAALRAVGVPVYREGLLFVIPSGRWSVVEACSGLRYLIASLLVGVLYAFLTYRSTRRRLLFIVVSVLVPMVANWLRAFMIVMIGHLSSNALATGVDHLVYGWVFFGLVMLLTFWIGGRWREDHLPLPASFFVETPGSAKGVAKGLLFAVIGAALLWKPLAFTLLQPSGVPVQLAEVTTDNGWEPRDAAFAAWQPDYNNPSATLKRAYTKGDLQAALYVAYYRDQGGERELINVNNQLARSKNDEANQLAWGHRELAWQDGAVKAATATMRYRSGRLRVWHWYWIDGHLTSSAYLAKIHLALAKLRGAGDDSALVLVYSPEEPKGEESLETFVRDMGPQIEAALKAAKAAN